MGFCFSCCRRQKSPERQPLLPKDREDTKPPRYDEILANIIAAINAGKLPSQTQLDHAARIILNSEVLNVENDRTSERGTISSSWRNIVKDLRGVIEASVEVGLQKNADDKIQEVIFLSKDISSESAHTSVTVDITSTSGSSSSTDSKIPSTNEIEADAKVLADSVRKLFMLVFTSSAFRILLQDVLVSAREALADTAAAVGRTAGQVQIAAEKVEHLVEPGNGAAPSQENFVSAFNEAEQKSVDAFVELQDETAQKARFIVTNRIQEVISRAHNSPEHKKAIKTILLLFRKYRKRLDEIASAAKDIATNAGGVEIHVEPQIWADDNLTIILVDIKCLLERFASNHSLDSVLHLFSVFMDDITASLFEPELETFLTDLGSWFDQALSDASFSISPVGKSQIEGLYDRGKTLTAEETKFGKDIREIFDALDSFLDALKSDRSSKKLMKSVDALSQDFTSLSQNQPAQLIEELKQDGFGWLLPRVLRVLRAIPMPRIEYVSNTLDVAVDALFLTTTSPISSLMPDHIRLESLNQLLIDVGEDTVQKDRFRIHVDGLRLAAKDLGYYVHYKGRMFRYEDEGLLSIFVGNKADEGLNFDADLEVDVEIGKDDFEALFLTKDVLASVTGLRFSISRSRHWIINKLFIQPFAGPIIHRVFEKVVSHYIRTGLDAFAQLVADVQKDAKASVPEGSLPVLEDYWRATILRLSDSSEKDDDSSQSSSPGTTVHTQPTMKGIVRTTQENTESSTPSTSNETTLALGMGPQLLPDKGLVALEENTTQVARDALDEVEAAVDHVQSKTQEVVSEARNFKKYKFDNFAKRIEKRKKVEKRNAGWKSTAFDLW